MNVFPSDLTTYFDVDDTLVVWGKSHHPDAITIDNYGHPTKLVPHTAHIEFLKRQKARGFTVVVWSQGGARWAESVVKALKLEQFVDVIITKPTMYVDDLKAEEFMTQRVYFRDNKADPELGNVTEQEIIGNLEPEGE